MLAIHLDGAFLTSKAVIPHMYKQGSGAILVHGLGPFQGGQSAQERLRHRRARPARPAAAIAKEGGLQGRAHQRDLPWLRAHAAGGQADPEQAKELGISEDEVVKKVMLGQTVDGEFTTVDDIAELALFFAAFPSNALTGQSLVASRWGWSMS